MNNEKPILYVEDEETDVFLMRLALRKTGLSSPLQVAVDGVQAIDYLAGRGTFADRLRHPVPALILLDINLPGKSGFEVLKWIREQAGYAALPVIMYTSSALEGDRNNARQLGVSDFILKKSDVNELAGLLRLLHERWTEQPGAQAK